MEGESVIVKWAKLRDELEEFKTLLIKDENIDADTAGEIFQTTQEYIDAIDDYLLQD